MERQRSHHGSSRTTTEEGTENPDAVAAAAAARRLARRAAYMRQYRASQSQDRLSQTKAQHALRQRLRRQSQDTAQETERRRQQQQQQLSTRDRYATTTTDRLIGNNNNNHPDYEEDRHPNNYPEIIRRDSAEARSALSWLQLKGDEDQKPRKLEQVSSGLKGDFLLPPQIHPFDKMDCVGLPPGWKREEVVRKSGLSAGKTDVYYYSPDGKKIRSKPQLARHIGDVIDLSAFDFRTGRIIHSALRKSKRPKGSTFDFARGMRHDSSLALPIRQTASIFKQPVTVIRTRPESRPKTDLKHGPQEQPKQLFWEKRLRGVQPRDVNDDPFVPLELPLNMQGMDSKGIGPDLTTENILQSIAAALHVSNIPVTGQNSSKSIQKNPGVNMDANQPKMQYMMVSDNDVRRQEHKVLDARRKLQAALVGVS